MPTLWEQDYYREQERLQLHNDLLLVAKQFMVMAHIHCPKPPVRYAKGLLQSTIRMENTYYLGMDSVIVYVGNKQAYYMPYTNEKWISPRWKGKQNPNYRWWDKSIDDVVELCKKKGVMMNG